MRQVLYTLGRIFIPCDISYHVRDGRVVKSHGKNSGDYVEHIESICRIHAVGEGMIFGFWKKDHYRLKVTGNLRQAITPLKNCIQ